MMSSQLGKTTALWSAMLGLSVTHPSPAMLVTPDRPANTDLRTRVYQVCDASHELKDLAAPEPRRNDLWIDLKLSTIHLGVAENKQTLSGKSCRRVFCTEVDRYDKKKTGQGDTLKLAEQRVAAFPAAGRLIFCESTPQKKGESRIAYRYYKLSDQRTYHVPCPHCGHYQELRFFPHKDGPHAGKGGIHGLRKDDGSWCTPEEAREAAWYCCESCGDRIRDEDKADIIPRGVWCPAGCKVVDGKLEGEPYRGKRHAGFHLSRLYAPIETCTFGAVAAEYLAARDGQSASLMQIFWNDWLGLPYDAATRTPEWQSLRRLCADVPRGEVHPEAVFLTAGCDVQHDRLYWIIRGWGIREHQPTSWLVDYGIIYCDRDERSEPLLGSDLAKLDGVLARTFLVYGGERRLPLSLALIDSGYAVRNSEVYEFCRRRPQLIRAIKGAEVSGLSGPVGWRRTEVERSATDGTTVQGFPLWIINVSRYKEELRRRWLIPKDQAGAWCLCREKDVGEEYLRQMVNEQEQLDTDKKTGRPKVVWVNQRNGIGCDLWDCEVYGRAAAGMWVGEAWHSAKEMLAKAMAPPPAKPPEQQQQGKGFVRKPGGRWLGR